MIVRGPSSGTDAGTGDGDGAVVNYFDVRWIDGYGHVSDAGGSLAVAIEEVCSSVTVHGDAVTLAIRRLRGGPDSRAVGLIRFDVVTSSGPRTLTYVHAVALPVGYQLDDDAWQRLVARRYGDDPAGRIRAAYEQMAATTKDAGRELLVPFTFDQGDVAVELGAPPPRPVMAPAAAPSPSTSPSKAASKSVSQRPLPGAALPPPPTKTRGLNLGAGAALADEGGALPEAPDTVPTGSNDRRQRADDSLVFARREQRVVAGHRARAGFARWAASALGLVVVALIAVAANRRCSRGPTPAPPPTDEAALRAELEQLRAERDRTRVDLDARTVDLGECTAKLDKIGDLPLRTELAAAKEETARARNALEGAVRDRDRAKADSAKLVAWAETAERDARQARADLDRLHARVVGQDALIGRLRLYMADECRRLKSTSCLLGIPK